jgi:hypothetical protein
MNVVNMGSDPYGVEESQNADRLRLAQLIQMKAMDNTPTYSTTATIAKALMGALGGYEQGQAEKGQRDLADRKTAAHKGEIDALFAAAQGDGKSGPDRATLAKLLAGSSSPDLQSAGLGMILKGPGKVDWHDAGSELVGTDEAGNVVRHVPKGITPDAKYGKETVSADKVYDNTNIPASARFTQDQENQRQKVNLNTVPASASFAQNREDARFAQTQDKPQVVQGPNGEVFTVRPNAGTGAPVVGPDGQTLSKGDKPLTETQSNAAGFGMRAKSANEIIGALEAGGTDLSSVTGLLAKTRTGNVAAPDWAQKAQQAKLNFMSATLRKESGANITPSEYDAEDRKYFPQPGDGAAVQDQKRQARALAIETLKVQAGQQGSKAIDHVGGGAAKINGDADYAALPSGAVFIGPDGKTRRKP